MVQNYEVGTKAWQPDPTEGWVASELESRTVDGDKVKLVFVLASGEVRCAIPHFVEIWTWCLKHANMESRVEKDS